MEDFILIPANVLREALEVTDGDTPGSDSLAEHLRSPIRGRAGEPPGQEHPSPP